jgi:uncharacterized membrane protein
MRYASIDALRTLAIVLMVLVHFTENLAGWVIPFAGSGAPMFVILSGVSFALWVEAQARRGVPAGEVTRRGVRRGAFLFLVGLAFNALVWMPEDIFNWDVLTLIGVGLVVLTLARHAPTPLLLGAAALAIAVTPALQVTVGAHEYWMNPWYDYDWTLRDVVVGFLAAGYFPLFPWIAYPLIGLAIGRWVYLGGEARRQRARGLARLGVLTLVASVLLRWGAPRVLTADGVAPLVGWRMFPATTQYTLQTIGQVLVLLGLLGRFVDGAGASKRGWRELVGLFSRSSFTLYVLHHLVHVWPLWIAAEAKGLETTHFWRESVSREASVGLALAFLVACVPLLRWRERRRVPSLEQLMRWFAD